MKAKSLPLNDNVKIKKTEYNKRASLYSFFFSGTGEFIEIPITSL